MYRRSFKRIVVNKKKDSDSQFLRINYPNPNVQCYERSSFTNIQKKPLIL
jgi:hypothetical protein